MLEGPHLHLPRGLRSNFRASCRASFRPTLGQRDHALHGRDRVQLAVLAEAANGRISQNLSEREPGAEHLDGVEGEFGVEAALDVGGLAEAVLLAREQEIADRIAFAP